MIKFGLRIVRQRTSRDMVTIVNDYFLLQHQNIIVDKSETLFDILEYINVIEDYTNNLITIKELPIKEYLKTIISNLEISKTDIKNISIIKNLVSKLPYYDLKVLEDYFTLLNKKTLFNEVTKRQLYSEYGVATIPYKNNLHNTIKTLNISKQDYCVYTSHIVNSLTDICLISLFEYVDLSYLIKECSYCYSNFFASKKEYLCQQKNENNNFMGCKKHKTQERINIRNFNATKSTLRKKRIYNRYYKRYERNPNEENKKKLSEFALEWKNLLKISKQFSEYQQEKYLNDFLDKWDF